MSGWLKIKEGDITLIHHSTASVIQVILEDENDKEELWMDYYQWNQLKKAIKETES